MNKVVPLTPGADVAAYRASTEAAEICKEIVLATSVTIQRRQYVPVEGWQAIAIAHGCAAASRDVERVDGGIKAVGEVRRMSDGQLISTAEGFVGEDEAVWFGGQIDNKSYPKRAEYAIRAMAQTRAISRACRSAFAHVVVMMNKGLATTPAEEVYDAESGEILQNVGKPSVPGIHKIKERLRPLLTEGAAQTDLEVFNELVGQHKADLQTIKDANHEWWIGDGEDFEGFKSFIRRRREELETEGASVTYQLLVSTLNECDSTQALRAWLKQNGDVVETLDGEQSRTFEALYDEKEAALKLIDSPPADAEPHPAIAKADEIIADINECISVMDVTAVMVRSELDIAAMPDDLAVKVEVAADQRKQEIEAARAKVPANG